MVLETRSIILAERVRMTNNVCLYRLEGSLVAYFDVNRLFQTVTSSVILNRTHSSFISHLSRSLKINEIEYLLCVKLPRSSM